MSNAQAFNIAVLPGDGIGIEVMDAAVEVLRAVQRKLGGFQLKLESLPAGAGHYRETGAALPEGHPAAGKTVVDGEATAYVCVGTSCSLPITTPEGLRTVLHPG